MSAQPFFDRRLLRLAQTARVHLTATILLGLLGGVLTVLQAQGLSRVVGQVFLAGGDLASARPLLIGLAALALGRALAVGGSEAAAVRIASRVKRNLREQLFEHLLALGPAHVRDPAAALDGERTGELTNTLTEGIEALDPYFSQYLPALVMAVLTPLTILVFVAPLDLISGLVLFLTAPLIPVFMILIGGLGDALARRQWTALSRMSAHFLDVLQGLTTLKLFNRSREQIGVIAEISDRHRAATMAVLRVTFLSALALELVSTLSIAVVAVQVGLRLLFGYLPFEQAFFVLILAPEFYLPLRNLGLRFHAAMTGATAAQRIFAILETAPAPLSHQPVVLPPAPWRIDFQNVSFAYPNAERPALSDASFSIASGQTVALVGPSGAGKTTIAQLLLRFIAPTSGAIAINGLPLEGIPAAQWQKQIAWAPQMPYLFNASIGENIRLARPGASQADVMAAAQLAHAHDFIAALPLGYDTVIGERGARLSGGQAQRVALARAFLKDAPILILDESTSNLDPEQEIAIRSAIERLIVGRAVIVIAHRLNTVRRADQILVVDAGRVVETGDHAALMARQGVYYRLRIADCRCWIADVGLPMLDCRLPIANRQLQIAHPKSKIANPKSIIPLMALAALLGFLTVGSGIGLMAISAWLIASAALHPSIAELQIAIVGVRFFGISRGLLRYAERLVSHDVTFRILARLRTRFYAAIEPLAPARLLAHRSGDLLSRIVADVATLENLYVRGLAPPLTALLVLLLMAGFMARYDPRLALTLLSFLLLAGLGVPLLARALSRRPGRETVLLRADLNAALVDSIQGMADLIAFGQARGHAGRVARLSQTLIGAQERLAMLGSLNSALDVLLVGLATVAVLAVAIPLIGGGRLSGVDLAVLALATAASFEAVFPLPAAAQHLASCLTAAGRLSDLTATEEGRGDRADAHAAAGGSADEKLTQRRQDAEAARRTQRSLATFAPLREASRAIFGTVAHTGRGASLPWLRHAVQGAQPPCGTAHEKQAGWIRGFSRFGGRRQKPADPERRLRTASRPERALIFRTEEPEKELASEPHTTAAEAGPVIRFEGVRFRYETDARPALDDVTFAIAAGQRTAIVGPSGAGKSTIVNLLLRFWESGQGRIELAGRDLREYTAEDARRLVAAAAQSAHLFNATIRENLRLARPDATQAEIEQAAAAAQIHDFIAALPQGYDTWVGEQGLRLSGGERQRLNIARALLKEAPILILDEPTANLDPLTARAVLQGVQAQAAGRAMLIITHRLAGLEAADEILVLAGGRIVERGRHAALLAAGGVYHRMWNAQAEAAVLGD
ncbi:MAG: thiol reductant ABC exporter subunit CydD [Chloroflexi bacterium]|nr:thiol reductant ABC exporter subunit CydD [Chloroflexota bacterium]